MSKWIDRTSYSYNDKTRTPNTWAIGINNRLDISLVKGHIYNPDSWVMHCPALALKEVEIAAIDDITLEQAQAHAIDYVEACIVALANSIAQYKREKQPA